MFPEGRGDLKVIALVAHHIQERPIARELDQFTRRVGPDGFFGLPVQVSPVVQQRGIRGNLQRVADAQTGSRGIKDLDTHIPRFMDRQVFDAACMLASTHLDRRGQSQDGPIGSQREHAIHLVAGVAPFVLTLESQTKGLTHGAQRRDDRFPDDWRARHDRDGGLRRQFGVVVGGERVGQHPEFEGWLAEGLHPHAG